MKLENMIAFTALATLINILYFLYKLWNNGTEQKDDFRQ